MSNAFSWDLDSGNQGGGSGKVEFTKLPEGITRLRILDDAPYQRWTHFFKRAKRSINCPGKGCPICEIRRQEKANGLKQHTHDMAKRFAFNVLNRETKRVEVLEQGKTFVQDLKDIMTDLKEEQLTLKDVDLKVRRRGTTKDDTSYRVDIDTREPMSNDDAVLAQGKVNFEEYFVPHTPEQILRVLNGEEWEVVMKREDAPESTSIVNNEGIDNDVADEEIELG